jgi:Calpain family cysteine protease
VLTGAPAQLITMSSVSENTDTVWNQVSAALAANYLVGCDTPASTIDSLPGSHAYSVLGAYPLKDTSGNVVYRLLHVRNPWNLDIGYYSGAWADGSSSWTAAYRAQVPYIYA